jgi:hypothetical protein
MLCIVLNYRRLGAPSQYDLWLSKIRAGAREGSY